MLWHMKRHSKISSRQVLKVNNSKLSLLSQSVSFTKNSAVFASIYLLFLDRQVWMVFHVVESDTWVCSLAQRKGSSIPTFSFVNKALPIVDNLYSLLYFSLESIFPFCDQRTVKVLIFVPFYRLLICNAAYHRLCVCNGSRFYMYTINTAPMR